MSSFSMSQADLLSSSSLELCRGSSAWSSPSSNPGSYSSEAFSTWFQPCARSPSPRLSSCFAPCTFELKVVIALGRCSSCCLAY